jgi:hypothetical protein
MKLTKLVTYSISTGVLNEFNAKVERINKNRGLLSSKENKSEIMEQAMIKYIKKI